MIMLQKQALSKTQVTEQIGFLELSSVWVALYAGLLSIFNPTASNQLSESSMIQIDGNGIFLILCIVAIVVGAYLLLKNTTKK